MARPTAAGRDQRGVAYLALLIIIAAMGVALATTGTLWHEVQRRDKEKQLLFSGLQFRRAIQQYHDFSPGNKAYPQTLEALLLDQRTPAIKRHLRQIYRDPLTANREWGLVAAPQGGIMGVYSLAAGVPLKQAGFPDELEWTGGKANYAEWKFVYQPANTRPGPKN